MKIEYIRINKDGNNYKKAVQAYSFEQDPQTFYYFNNISKDYVLVDRESGYMIIFASELKDLISLYNKVYECIKKIRTKRWYQKRVMEFKKLKILEEEEI